MTDNQATCVAKMRFGKKCGQPAIQGTRRCDKHTMAGFRCGYKDDGRPSGCYQVVPAEGIRCRAHSPESLAKAQEQAIDYVARHLAARDRHAIAAHKEMQALQCEVDRLEFHKRKLERAVADLIATQNRVQREIDDVNAEVNARQWQEKSNAMQVRAAELLMSSAPSDADRDLASSLIEAARELRISHGGAATPYQPERGYRTKRTATKRNGKAGPLVDHGSALNPSDE
jgi:chromosome segregation ATPase